MMIKYAIGDIFGFPEANALVNTVNCVGVMGKGVALAFSRRYPLLVSAYRQACRAKTITPGSLWCWTSRDGRIVYNIATKNHWRDPSQYRWVESGLARLALALRQLEPLTVIVPPLGCGCGGLDWEVVKPMIKSSLEGLLHHTIIVLEPQ